MGGKLILYYIPGSPPARTAVLIGKALGLDMELKALDFFKGEHLKPEYVKLNPQHTVPTLVDDGKPLWDSHAIATYLVGKYGKKNDPLYPSDLYTRARIDQRLQFESSVIFSAVREVVAAIFFGGAYEVSEKSIGSANQGYQFLEIFLTADTFLVGDHFTVADFSMITSVTQLSKFIPIDGGKYPKLAAWIQKFDSLPYFHDINTVWLNDFVKLTDGIMAKNRASAEASK